MKVNSKIEWMVDTFLNSANYAPHVLLTLAPPSWYALNLKALIKMSKVCWTYSFDMKHLDLHLKSLIRIALVDYVLKPAVYTVSPPTNFLWKPKIIPLMQACCKRGGGRGGKGAYAPQILADQKVPPASGGVSHFYLPPPPQIFRLCNMPVMDAIMSLW